MVQGLSGLRGLLVAAGNQVPTQAGGQAAHQGEVPSHDPVGHPAQGVELGVSLEALPPP